MNTVVIIGTSAAGLAAAGKLRALNPSIKIVCLTKEVEMPYNRCLIADCLAGSKTSEQVCTKKAHFFEEQSIELRLSSEVIALDATKKQITVLFQGKEETLTYDALLIASGRSAFVPAPFLPLQPGVFPFYDLSHVTEMLGYIESTHVKRALVVGGGISGLECADALLSRGLMVTIVEREASLLPSQIDADGALFLAQLLRDKGIVLHCQTTVEELASAPHEQGGVLVSVSLSNGIQQSFDLVVVATGGRQNSSFARDAGIACDQFGIITDIHQATNLPGVFAAGDICSVIDLLTEKRTCSTLWPDAVAQGLSAAHSIAGLSKPYAGTLTITSTHVFGTTLVSCGDFNTLAADETLSKQEAAFYHKFYLSKGIVRGFVMIGNVGSVGQLRKAILEKTPLV